MFEIVRINPPFAASSGICVRVSDEAQLVLEVADRISTFVFRSGIKTCPANHAPRSILRGHGGVIISPFLGADLYGIKL